MSYSDTVSRFRDTIINGDLTVNSGAISTPSLLVNGNQITGDIITSVGTLPNLTVSGNVNTGNLNINSGSNINVLNTTFPDTIYPTEALSANIDGYYVSTSSFLNNDMGYFPFKLFNKNTTNSNFYHSGRYYNKGQYTGSTSTTDNNSNVYNGEYIQIQLPTQICLYSYKIYAKTDTADTRSPRKFYILGSNNNTTWYLVDEQNENNWSSIQSVKQYYPNSNNKYNYFRLVIKTIGNVGNNDPLANNGNNSSDSIILCEMELIEKGITLSSYINSTSIISTSINTTSLTCESIIGGLSNSTLLHINSNVGIDGNIGVIGYKTTNTGCSVTQLTDKGTQVTLNTASGIITLNTAQLNRNTTVSFTFNNNLIKVSSHLIVNHVSGGTLGAYTVTASPSSGSATIYVRNITNSDLTEIINLRFTLLSGASI